VKAALQMKYDEAMYTLLKLFMEAKHRHVMMEQLKRDQQEK
jgi:hypothetical protein